MLNAYSIHRLLTMFAILAGFWVGSFFIPVKVAMAAPKGLGANVVIMDCSETEDDTFAVEDISSTKDVGVSIDDDCADALQTLLGAGYSIVPGGGGAVYAADESNEHIVYTLVQPGFAIGSLIPSQSFNFSKR